MVKFNDLICSHCQGKGILKTDAEVGTALRAARQWKGITGREMATAIEVSPAYLSDLEQGRRNWSVRRIDYYLVMLANLGGGKEQNNA